MSWIQENKFTASVLGATVVVAGALFYLGNSARSEAKEQRTQSNAIVAETNAIKAKKPFPTSSNKKLVDNKVAAFTKDALAFQASLLKYRPEKMPKVSSATFNSNVSEHIKSLKKLYSDSGITLPKEGDVAFGMELYRSKMANSRSTRVLNYQRKALHWLFAELAKAEPTSLDNVFRSKIQEEVGPIKSPHGGKKSSNRKSAPVDSVYRALPIELTFTGSEHALKQFLAGLSNSKDYFFITRSIRVRNEKRESPNLKDAEFAKPKVQDLGDFGDFEGLEAGEASDGKGEPVLKQVAGNEKIKVHLKLDLVLFKEASEVIFPGAKKAKKSAAKSSTPNK